MTLSLKLFMQDGEKAMALVDEPNGGVDKFNKY